MISGISVTSIMVAGSVLYRVTRPALPISTYGCINSNITQTHNATWSSHSYMVDDATNRYSTYVLVLLCCVVMCCAVLYKFIALRYSSVYCIALHCIALHCITLHCITLHYIVLHCIALHCLTLHCNTLHYIILH